MRSFWLVMAALWSTTALPGAYEPEHPEKSAEQPEIRAELVEIRKQLVEIRALLIDRKPRISIPSGAYPPYAWTNNPPGHNSIYGSPPPVSRISIPSPPVWALMLIGLGLIALRWRARVE